MNFVDFLADVKVRSARFATRLEHLETEEATKTSLVLPFLQMMGYSIFDPEEVRPEYTADVGTKKGEKVDYALLRDKKPVILIECKKYNAPLAANEANQLLRYFGPTKTARIGILTDGVIYRFFSDLQDPNTMDETPFFEFNMLKVNDEQVSELYKFTKDEFSTDKIVGAAQKLREKSEVRAFLERELEAPSERFVQFVTSDESVHTGHRTQAVRDRYKGIIREAWNEYIQDALQSRWERAAKPEQEEAPHVDAAVEAEADAPGFVPAERDALLIVKAIVHDLVDVRGIALRSFKQYCSVLLDDNIRKSICRLYLREQPWRVGFLDEQRREERVNLEDLDGLYAHALRLRDAVGRYLAAPEGVEPPDS